MALIPPSNEPYVPPETYVPRMSEIEFLTYLEPFTTSVRVQWARKVVRIRLEALRARGACVPDREMGEGFCFTGPGNPEVM